jgi:hypothetical protein
VVQLYRPSEADGQTALDSADLNVYRLRMRFADGERVLKNGDSF